MIKHQYLTFSSYSFIPRARFEISFQLFSTIKIKVIKVKIVDQMIQSAYLCVNYFTCQAQKLPFNAILTLIMIYDFNPW